MGWIAGWRNCSPSTDRAARWASRCWRPIRATPPSWNWRARPKATRRGTGISCCWISRESPTANRRSTRALSRGDSRRDSPKAARDGRPDLRYRVRRNEGGGVDEARVDARALLLAAAGLTHAQWVLEPSALLGQEAASRLAGYAARRA